MTLQDIEEVIKEAICSVAEINETSISIDDSMDTLNLDSIDIVEITHEIELALDFQFDDDIRVGGHSIRSLASYIKNL